MLRATYFDLDGPIADTEPLHRASVRETLASAGIELDERAYHRGFLALTDHATFLRAADDFARPDLAARLEELARS